MNSFIPVKKELFRESFTSFSNQRKGMITSTRKETRRRKGVWREMKGAATVRSAMWVVDGCNSEDRRTEEDKQGEVLQCMIN